MKKLTVYILKCSDGSFYVGVTNNIVKRLSEHEQGLSDTAYVRTRLPVELVFSQEFADPKLAIALEKKIKGWRREKKIALIEGRLTDLPELSRSKSAKEKD